MTPRAVLCGPLAAALVALLALAGCDTDGAALVPEPELAAADSAYVALLADVGGLDGLAALLRTSSDAELAATFDRYGMAFEVVDRADTEVPRDDPNARRQDIAACPQRFPTADRVKWFRLVGAGGPEDHYVDSRGRPATAFRVPPRQDGWPSVRGTYHKTPHLLTNGPDGKHSSPLPVPSIVI